MVTLHLDEHGFLQDYAVWTHEHAQQLAELASLTLSSEHWDVINYFRDFYLEYRLTPSMRILLQHLKSIWPQQTVNSIYLAKLFPQGVFLQGSQLAGLPKPARCM